MYDALMAIAREIREAREWDVEVGRIRVTRLVPPGVIARAPYVEPDDPDPVGRLLSGKPPHEILVHPTDWTRLVVAKVGGEWAVQPGQRGSLTVFGVPIVR